jgi:hypothetical protein
MYSGHAYYTKGVRASLHIATGVSRFYIWIWILYVTVPNRVNWYSSNEIGVHSNTARSHLDGTTGRPKLEVRVS